MAKLWFQSMGQLPNAFFQGHQWGEPEVDGDISTLQLWDVINSASTTIQWNNDTGTGSIQGAGYRDGEEVCWNEQFGETAC